MRLFNKFEKTAKDLTSLVEGGDMTPDESYDILLNSISSHIEEYKDVLPHLWKRICEIRSKTS